MHDQQLASQIGGRISGANLSEAKCAIQRPETEIESVMTRTSNAASRLHSRIDALYDRLSRVRTPVGAAASGTVGGAPQSVMSQLGEDIRGIEQQIDGAVDRLESLLRDLAL